MDHNIDCIKFESYTFLILFVDSIRIRHFTSPGSSVTTDAHNGITMTLRFQ